MKKEAKSLLKKAIDSLILSIEHFNRPSNRGRVEAVLILLDHSFEMLLKSALLHKGEKIRKKKENQTIGFEDCIKNCIPAKIISEQQVITLRAINALRDGAQHHLISLSEQHLYLHAQAALTIFKDVYTRLFKKSLISEFPKRVLPISTTPPLDITTLFESEVEEVKKLLVPRRKNRLEAITKIRTLAIFDNSVKGEHKQPEIRHINNLERLIKEGKRWEELFPHVASIRLVSEGTGPTLSLRITKKNGIPIKLVPEDTPGATLVAVKKVNELDFYNLNLTSLSRKLDIGPIKTLALIEHLELKKDANYYKEIVMGKSSVFKRYSQETLKKLKEELPKISIDTVWEEYKDKRRKVSANATYHN